ncbi:MAG: hypothetical protein ACLUGQ_12970 [Coprococcus sp.]
MLKGAEIILVQNDCGSMQPRIEAAFYKEHHEVSWIAVAMANPEWNNAG